MPIKEQDKDVMTQDQEEPKRVTSKFTPPPDPLERLTKEMLLVAQGGSAQQLRKVLDEIYPRNQGKEESMRFMASLTRLEHAAETIRTHGQGIHASIMNAAT